MTENLTVGERVAWYRRRRGMSQEVLAGLIGRTADWLQRAENNRIQLDRLSVIRSLAEVLDVSIGDLIGEPTLLDWTAESRTQTVPALRAVLMDYSQLSTLLASGESDSEPPALDQLARKVDAIFEAYQHSGSDMSRPRPRGCFRTPWQRPGRQTVTTRSAPMSCWRSATRPPRRS